MTKVYYYWDKIQGCTEYMNYSLIDQLYEECESGISSFLYYGNTSFAHKHTIIFYE